MFYFNLISSARFHCAYIFRLHEVILNAPLHNTGLHITYSYTTTAPRSKLVKDENVDLLADSLNILNRWKNYFSQLLNIHRVSR
jgi:hypothetical protein